MNREICDTGDTISYNCFTSIIRLIWFYQMSYVNINFKVSINQQIINL